MNEAFKISDEVKYSDRFARMLSDPSVRNRRGVVVSIPYARRGAVTVRWADGMQSICLPDNLDKIVKTEGIGDTSMSSQEQSDITTKAVILHRNEGVYVPVDQASRNALVEAGLPESIDGDNLAVTDVEAGRLGLTLVVDAPRTESFAQAWDLISELGEQLGEDMSVFDRVQWLAERGPDSDAAIRIVSPTLSESFGIKLGAGLRKLGMVAEWNSEGCVIDFIDSKPSRFQNRSSSLSIRSMASCDLFEALTGIELKSRKNGRIETTTTGPVFVTDGTVSPGTRQSISEAEANLLAMANSDSLNESTGSNRLIENSILSFIHDPELGEPELVLESKFSVLCYESPKTIKGEKKGMATGILYLAPADASGKNVCPMASGLIAREYATRLEHGSTLEELVATAEEDLNKSSNPRKRGELEEIVKILRQAKDRNAGKDTLKAWLKTIGCAGSCLGIRSGKGILSKVQEARERKTRQLMDDTERPKIIQDIVDDINRLSRFSKKNKMTPTVRLNGTSDLPWWKDERFFITDEDGNRVSIIEYFGKKEGIQFYDYSKRPEFMKAFLAGKEGKVNFPKNYHLTFSYSGYNWDQCEEFLKQGGSIAMAFRITANEPKPLSINGYRVIDGDVDDIRTLDDKGVIVGLSAKGQTGRYATSFIVSPTGSKFDIKWPKDSQYAKMSKKGKAEAETKATDDYLGKVSMLDARQRYREEITEKVIASPSYWKKYVEPAAKKLRADLRSGAYTNLKAYYQDFFPVAEKAFTDFLSGLDPEVQGVLKDRKINPDDKEYFAGRVVALIRGSSKGPEHIKPETVKTESALPEKTFQTVDVYPYGDGWNSLSRWLTENGYDHGTDWDNWDDFFASSPNITKAGQEDIEEVAKFLTEITGSTFMANFLKEDGGSLTDYRVTFRVSPSIQVETAIPSIGFGGTLRGDGYLVNGDKVVDTKSQLFREFVKQNSKQLGLTEGSELSDAIEADWITFFVHQSKKWSYIEGKNEANIKFSLPSIRQKVVYPLYIDSSYSSGKSWGAKPIIINDAETLAKFESGDKMTQEAQTPENDPTFNSLPAREIVAKDIVAFAQELASRPVKPDPLDVDYTFMFGVPPGMTHEIASAVKKATDAAPSDTRIINKEALYVDVIQILMRSITPSDTRPWKKGFETIGDPNIT